MTNRKRKKRQAGAVPKKIVTPVYNQILVQPVHRGINDIGTWKSALRAADMGLRSKLYDLYEDILMDDCDGCHRQTHRGDNRLRH